MRGNLMATNEITFIVQIKAVIFFVGLKGGADVEKQGDVGRKTRHRFHLNTTMKSIFHLPSLYLGN
jgi:hypothetical protein